MVIDPHIELCQRIREHCLRNNWYGPEGLKGHRGYHYVNDILQNRPLTHNPHIEFEFPPATEKQLQITEKILGFPLLPSLRAIYTLVANGGFGPGSGITGANGGFFHGNDGRYKTIDMCTDTDKNIQYIDIEAYKKNQGASQTIELPSTTKPAHFLHLCYWGGGMDSWIDGKRNAVYLVVVSKFISKTSILSYYCQENSLEDWLTHWLTNDIQHWFPEWL